MSRNIANNFVPRASLVTCIRAVSPFPLLSAQSFSMASGKSYFNANVPEIVVKSLFQKYDTDGSGRLGKQEVLTLLKDDLGLKEDQAQAQYMLMDKDGDGDMSFDELRVWLRSGQGFSNIDNSSRYYVLQKAIAEFKKYDKDGNGTIDKEEFKSLMRSLGYSDESQFDNAMRSLDTSGDGKISFTEFLAWLNWLPTN